ncbi:hypothetical protein XELAEV_18000291mg [Xenopus laevis]|uniref:Uncharacterized protein n=1 Tax=Xenopus laevis TaxID=8355 RepID=A0A974BP74_XENLA|nr:hypothetical protein XELAEV_18000291mg [Xenopus laevis]
MLTHACGSLGEDLTATPLALCETDNRHRQCETKRKNKRSLSNRTGDHWEFGLRLHTLSLFELLLYDCTAWTHIRSYTNNVPGLMIFLCILLYIVANLLLMLRCYCNYALLIISFYICICYTLYLFCLCTYPFFNGKSPINVIMTSHHTDSRHFWV